MYHTNLSKSIFFLRQSVKHEIKRVVNPTISPTAPYVNSKLRKKTTYPMVIKHQTALVSGIINVALPSKPNKWGDPLLRALQASRRITISLRDLQNRLLTASGSTRTCSFNLVEHAQGISLCL